MKKFDHNSGEYLNIGGAKIYYEVIGNKAGPALLFLHGGFGNIEDINNVLSELLEEFKVIGIDTRGHGKSTLGLQELTYELLQKDVEKVLEHLNISTLTILGFSDGGIVAYRLASLTNLKVNKLITIGSGWHKKYMEPMKEFYSTLTGEKWKARHPSHYESYQRLNPEPDFNHLTKLLIKMWLDTSASGYPNEQVKNISCPLLIVRGENDPVVSESEIDELSEIVKTAQLLNIPSAGHAVFEDQQELFTIRLKEFLEA